MLASKINKKITGVKDKKTSNEHQLWIAEMTMKLMVRGVWFDACALVIKLVAWSRFSWWAFPASRRC